MKQYVYHHVFIKCSAVRRPPSAVRRPSSAVRRPPSAVRPPFIYTPFISSLLYFHFYIFTFIFLLLYFHFYIFTFIFSLLYFHFYIFTFIFSLLYFHFYIFTFTVLGTTYFDSKNVFRPTGHVRSRRYRVFRLQVRHQ